MTEDEVFALFLLAPLLSGGALVIFAHHLRRRSARSGWKPVLLGNVLLLAFLVSLLFIGGETYYRFIYDTTDSLN